MALNKLTTAVAAGTLAIGLSGPAIGAETTDKSSEFQEITADTQTQIQSLLQECDADGDGKIKGKEVKCKIRYNIKQKEKSITSKEQDIASKEQDIASKEQDISMRKENIKKTKEEIEQLKNEILKKVS